MKYTDARPGQRLLTKENIIFADWMIPWAYLLSAAVFPFIHPAESYKTEVFWLFRKKIRIFFPDDVTSIRFLSSVACKSQVSIFWRWTGWCTDCWSFFWSIKGKFTETLWILQFWNKTCTVIGKSLATVFFKGNISFYFINMKIT